MRTKKTDMRIGLPFEPLRIGCMEINDSEVIAGAGSSGIALPSVLMKESYGTKNKANPNTNRGIVLAVRAVEVGWNIDAGTGSCSVRMIVQLRRSNPDREIPSTDVTVGRLASEDGTSDIAFETTIVTREDRASNTPVLTEHPQKYFEFPCPLLFVRPIVFKPQVEQIISSAAQTVVIRCWIYVYYTSHRVEGEEYRRLLDAYSRLGS